MHPHRKGSSHSHYRDLCVMGRSKQVLKAEGLMRLVSLVLAFMSALLLGFLSETEDVMFARKRATVHDLQALWVLTILASGIATYQLLQLCRCLGYIWLSKDSCGCSKLIAWIYFLLDQGSTYATFTGTMAATQQSAIAVFGVSHLQWGKLCNIYTRFCEQTAGGLFCGLLASIAMAVVSSISGHRLFRQYPSPDGRRPGRPWAAQT